MFIWVRDEREGGREGGREGMREGEREREGGRVRGREGGRKGGREEGRKGGNERGREGGGGGGGGGGSYSIRLTSSAFCTSLSPTADKMAEKWTTVSMLLLTMIECMSFISIMSA